MDRLDARAVAEVTIAEMLAWQDEQKYRLRTGRRSFTGPAYRDDGAIPPTNRRALLTGRSVVSLALDCIFIALTFGIVWAAGRED